MRQAGLNVSGFCSVNDLTLVAAAGLTCLVTDPRANGYHWTKMPGEREIRKNLASLAREINDDPTVLGLFLYDEPTVRQMPGLGKVVRLLSKTMPDEPSYINLLPSDATLGDMGVTSYDDYLKRFIHEVHPPFLSFDNYSVEQGVLLDRFFENLEAIRQWGLETKTPFWVTVLSDAHFNFMAPSDATLHLQVYSALAYGARGIEYFPYFAPAYGNFRDAAVDAFGHRTRTWAMLRRVNEEVENLVPVLITLHSTGVYFSAPVPKGSKPLSASPLVASINATVLHAKPEPASFLIGEFKNAEGQTYLLLVNRDLKASMHFSIELRKPYRRLIWVSPFTGKEMAFTRFMRWVGPGAGVLFHLK